MRQGQGRATGSPVPVGADARRLAIAAGALAFAALSWACPGTLDDPGPFVEDLWVGRTPDPAEPPCPDIPEVLRQSCAGACHGATSPEANLDLESDDVAGRLVDAPGEHCAGTLIVPGDPEGSLLYAKLVPPVECGSLMPLGPTPLEAEIVDCIALWIDCLDPEADPEDCDAFAPPTDAGNGNGG
jgi:hypothetical protein